MPIQVIIKSAAQSVEDFTLDCEITWTIAQVKDQITTLYPTKPKREHQKLIYGGKLLPDHLTLESVLNKMNDIHVLHIVCPFPPVSNTQISNVNNEKSVPPVCATPPPNSSGVYPQVNQQILTPGLVGGIPGIANGVGYTVPDAAQQYLLMQQMYTQFLTQYFAQYNGSIPHGLVNPNIMPVQQPQTTAPRQNAVPNVQQRQPEEAQRDYIDYLYMFSRAALLVAMLLCYSSFSRVMAVFVMVILLSIFAKVNRQHQREALRRANERQTAEAAAAATEQPTEEVPASENETTDDAATTEPLTPTQATTSVPSTIFTLVTAFFSSLIPTDPLPVHVN